MTVRGRSDHGFGADVAAGSGPVIDDDCTLERGGKFLADEPPERIISATRGEWHDDRNLPRWKILCPVRGPKEGWPPRTTRQ
jgi:hypothetical protein